MPEPRSLGQAGPQAHSWDLAPGALREGLCPCSPVTSCAMLKNWRGLYNERAQAGFWAQALSGSLSAPAALCARTMDCTSCGVHELDHAAPWLVLWIACLLWQPCAQLMCQHPPPESLSPL